MDDVTSGLDPSASTYIVSSSYANGNLVRSGGPETNVVTVAGGSRVTTQTVGTVGGTPSATTPTSSVSTGGGSGGSSSYSSSSSVSTSGSSSGGSSSY